MIIVDEQLWWIGHQRWAPDRLAVLRSESVEIGVTDRVEEAALNAVYRPSVQAIAVVLVSFDDAGGGAGRAHAARVVSLDELRWVEVLERLLWLLAEQREAA